MPTYEYHCEACDEVVEIFQSMTAAPAEVCPNCGKKSLRRLISGGTGIIFKGSGFYCTDYKSSSPSKASTTPPSSSSDSKSEKKSEPKKESKPKSESSKSSTTKK